MTEWEWEVWFIPASSHPPVCWYRGFRNRAMFLTAKWKRCIGNGEIQMRKRT